MTVVTRFAPSPTGRLHVGNIRTALHNALFALKNGGRFLLRIDDTDLERSREEFVEAILSDLDWLGLKADTMVRQSERFTIYEREFERLKQAAGPMPATKTPEELELRRKVLLGRGLPPVYERKPEDSPVPEGVEPHWRFKLDHGHPIEWDDLIRGHQKFDPKLISDPVIRRADGSWLYLLPSVIDDIDLSITHIVRGEDHVSNSAVQLQMFAALGAAPPRLAHEALLVAAEGKLSKRLGSYGAEHLREEGVEPMALLSLLARIGTSEPVEPITSLGRAREHFDFSHLRPGAGAFRPARVELLNAKLLHHLDMPTVADRLPEASAKRSGWPARQPRPALSEAEWVPVLTADMRRRSRARRQADARRSGADRGGRRLVGRPLACLDDQLKASTGRKGRALFHPLRWRSPGATRARKWHRS
jgi:glutamyl-tRNA synthetase